MIVFVGVVVTFGCWLVWSMWFVLFILDVLDVGVFEGLYSLFFVLL